MTWERKLSQEEKEYLSLIKNYRTRKAPESKTVQVAKLIALGGYAAACLVMPGLTQVHKLFNTNDQRYCKGMYQSVARLQKRGLIENIEGKFYLTHKGRVFIKNKELARLDYKSVKLKQAVWEMVIFDIPKDQKYARRILRRVLLKHGYVQVQQSVYVHKNYSHRESLDRLVVILEIGSCVKLFTVIAE